jgi:hypothetical protein
VSALTGASRDLSSSRLRLRLRLVLDGSCKTRVAVIFRGPLHPARPKFTLFSQNWTTPRSRKRRGSAPSPAAIIATATCITAL